MQSYKRKMIKRGVWERGAGDMTQYVFKNVDYICILRDRLEGRMDEVGSYLN